MTTNSHSVITSRDNALLKNLRKLSQDNSAYRKSGQIWIEGDHLCRAALERKVTPSMAVFAASYWSQAPASLTTVAAKNIVIPDALFTSISSLESPALFGFVIDLPAVLDINPNQATLILDRVQDAGNVGSMLRSAGAFGFKQVIAITGTAALWSSKVLRAGMGAHFGLQLIENVATEALHVLSVPIIVTSSHHGALVQHQPLPYPCAWAMGHEGQGVSADLAQRASLAVRIAQPGGEESLNVAAAAAICLYASVRAF